MYYRKHLVYQNCTILHILKILICSLMVTQRELLMLCEMHCDSSFNVDDVNYFADELNRLGRK